MVQCNDYIDMTKSLISLMETQGLSEQADHVQRALDESFSGTELAMRLRHVLESLTQSVPDSSPVRQGAKRILAELRTALA